MTDSSAVFFQALDARIESYDLLKHPFYQAWSKGDLTRDDLREYSAEYWHHVSAFPSYLSALHSQLPDGKLRRLVLENLADEEGLEDGAPHSDLWMDFARGMGANEVEVRGRKIGPETQAVWTNSAQRCMARLRLRWLRCMRMSRGCRRLRRPRPRVWSRTTAPTRRRGATSRSIRRRMCIMRGCGVER